MTEDFYIVVYSTGEWEDEYIQFNHFITTDLDLANKWCNKFNDIRNKWFKYYDDIVQQDLQHEDSDFATHIYNRVYTIGDYGEAWVEIIEKR